MHTLEGAKKTRAQKHEAVASLVAAVHDFHDQCRCLPSKSKSEQQCLEFVHGIITRIKALSAGGYIMVPGGWADKTEDFAFIFVIERVSTDRLTVAVCNSVRACVCASKRASPAPSIACLRA